MRSLLSQARWAFSGLRLRLLLMLLLGCAPLVALIWHAAGGDRRRAQAAWQSKLDRIAQIARNEEKQLFDSTHQLLLAVSEVSGVPTLDPETANVSLQGIQKSYPRYANLGLLTTNGQVVTSARPTLESNLSGHGFFRRVLDSRKFAFSGPSIPTASSGPRFYFGYPVRQKGGELSGVVYAELEFAAYARESDIPRHLPIDTTWTEVDSKGKVLASLAPVAFGGGPAPLIKAERVGRKLNNGLLLTNVLSQLNGTLELRDRQGIWKLYAFSKVPCRLGGTNVFGILATPRDTLFASADQALSRNLAALGVAASVALVLGWLGSTFLILRPVKALVRSSARLASGDMSARTGLKPSHDELGQLTQAFDQMAQALESREREHQRASNKLQVLSHRLVEVQEAERRHIARELHDEIGQSLTAAEINLQAALRDPPPDSLQKRLEDSIQAVERVLEQVHDLSLNLRPSMLDDLGLEPALRWYTHRQAGLKGMRAEFKAEPLEERLDPLIETECFRVAQEALNNVVRHAQARTVRVELTCSGDHLHLCVSDDGVGFDVNALHEEAVRGASLGLLSMEERTALAGGGLEFTSAPGNGTEIHAWFPLILRTRQLTSQFNE